MPVQPGVMLEPEPQGWTDAAQGAHVRTEATAEGHLIFRVVLSRLRVLQVDNGNNSLVKMLILY